jgi:hypothetical protein
MLSTIQELQMVDALVQSDWDRQTADSVVREVSLLSFLHFGRDLNELLTRLKASKKITAQQALQVRHYLVALEAKRELPALHALHAPPQANPYFIDSIDTIDFIASAPRELPALHAPPLRTGLGLPETRLWAFCKVVVLRPHAQTDAQKETFTVKLSQRELAPSATNDCLFRAITARVPFAQWEKMESYTKRMDFERVQGRRHRVFQPTTCKWPHWRSEYQTTEESARNKIYDVQYGLYHGCVDPDEYYEWTVVIYARADPMTQNAYTLSTVPPVSTVSAPSTISTVSAPLQSGVQSGVASSVASTPRPDPRSDPALRVHKTAQKTLAPKRQPPRPPRPPRPWGGADGPDDPEWVYSWRHFVRVGPAPGQWPQDSAEALAEESMMSDIDNDDDLNHQVQDTLSRDFDLLFVPCTAQDSAQWDHDRAATGPGFMLLGNEGKLMAFSETVGTAGPTPWYTRHEFTFTFRDDGQAVTRGSWSRRERVTDVVIEYTGPVRFRLRHPEGSPPLQERRQRPQIQ